MRHLILISLILSLLFLTSCHIRETSSASNSNNQAIEDKHVDQSKPSFQPEKTHPMNPTMNAESEADKQSSASASQNITYRAYATSRDTLQRRLNISQLWRKYPDIFKFHAANRSSKQVALTFDDVPDHSVTPIILDLLKEHGIKATFFIEGYRAKANPDMVKRMVAEGHIIGNHSYDHPLLTKASMPAFIHQLQSAETIITNIVGYKPRYFRPPFGEITEEQLQWAGDHGYIVVNWDVDSNDWRGISAMRVENNIMSQVQSGSIILQHAGGGGKPGYLQNTIQALPNIIQQLRKQQYEFVTLPELLDDRKDKRDY